MSFGRDTKAGGPFYLVHMPGKVKRSHTGVKKHFLTAWFFAVAASQRTRHHLRRQRILFTTTLPECLHGIQVTKVFHIKYYKNVNIINNINKIGSPHNCKLNGKMIKCELQVLSGVHIKVEILTVCTFYHKIVIMTHYGLYNIYVLISVYTIY